jgi:hypothetical protein
MKQPITLTINGESIGNTKPLFTQAHPPVGRECSRGGPLDAPVALEMVGSTARWRASRRRSSRGLASVARARRAAPVPADADGADTRRRGPAWPV